MKYLFIALCFLSAPGITSAQDWNVECNDGNTGYVRFVGNGTYGAALFWDTNYAVTQDYNIVIDRGPNLTVYQGDNAVLFVWGSRAGSTWIWSYPQGQRNYNCD